MKKKKENIRNSNHELMRLISMFFIVLWHIIIYANIMNNSTIPGFNYIIKLLQFIIIVHVNSFVLLTGYYQYKKDFKQSTLWKLINQTLFYKILIITILSIVGLISLDKITLLKEFFPINMTAYWFIKVYFLLYCISPFLNKLIKSLKQKEFRNLLIVGLIICSIIPAITNGGAFANDGYSLYSFIYLYFVGAYLHKYPLDKSYLFKIFSKSAYQIILISLFIFCFLSNYILYYFSIHMLGTNSILDTIAIYIRNNRLNYINVLVIIQSIAYFAFFTTLNFKSKTINKLAPLVLGVYLISDNPYIRTYIYKWVHIDNGPICSYKFLFVILLGAIIIYVGCLLIEFIRQVIFKFIYDRKISEKIRKKYYDFIGSIKILNN